MPMTQTGCPAEAMSDLPVILTIDIRIEDDAWREALGDVEAVVQQALEAAAQAKGVSGAVDLLLTHDADMQSLNAQWRDKDAPTDVLSFPADPDDTPPGAQRFLGDLALGFGVTQGDATKLERALDLHVMHLLVHGFLHLLGHDHMSPAEASEMEGLEAALPRIVIGPGHIKTDSHMTYHF